MSIEKGIYWIFSVLELQLKSIYREFNPSKSKKGQRENDIACLTTAIFGGRGSRPCISAARSL